MKIYLKGIRSYFDRVKVALGYIPNARSQILVAKRPESKSFGGMWELPGGKLENGESPEDCIVREIHEELAIVKT